MSRAVVAVTLMSAAVLLAPAAWSQQPGAGATEDPAGSDSQEADVDPAEPEEDEEATEEGESRAGYDEIGQFGGATSVGGKLKRADEIRRSRFGLGKLDRALEPWFETKEKIRERHGLSFGLIYQGLYQGASASLGEDQAAGGVFQFLASWALVGAGRTEGALTFQLEHRHRLGTDLAPEELFVDLGSAVSTGTDFSGFGATLSRLFWRQGVSQGRVVFAAGRVDPGDYVDTHPLNDPFSAFLNESLVASPTIGGPEPGLGGAFAVFLPSKIYLVAGLSDANGSFTRAGLDTFFEDREYFKHFEIGWIPSHERRYTDNVHLTAWHADERESAETPEGWGLNFSLARTLGERLVPFLRMGWSDGGLTALEATVASGLGIEFSQGDELGVGASWGRPAESGLRDQYTAELFYRLQVTSDFAVTPNVQVILDPAANPAESSIVVYSLRAGIPI